MAVLNVTTSNFEEEVLKSNQVVLVDFWATWCGPCRMLAPIVDEIATAHPEIKVCKVNVDEESALAMKYKTVSIPTLLVFKNGELVKQTIGVQSKSDIEKMITI